MVELSKGEVPYQRGHLSSLSKTSPEQQHSSKPEIKPASGSSDLCRQTFPSARSVQQEQEETVQWEQASDGFSVQ